MRILAVALAITLISTPILDICCWCNFSEIHCLATRICRASHVCMTAWRSRDILITLFPPVLTQAICATAGRPHRRQAGILTREQHPARRAPQHVPLPPAAYHSRAGELVGACFHDECSRWMLQPGWSDAGGHEFAVYCERGFKTREILKLLAPHAASSTGRVEAVSAAYHVPELRIRSHQSRALGSCPWVNAGPWADRTHHACS